MKKIFFPLLAAALVMTACESKTSEQTAGSTEAQTEANAQIGSGDIAYVQVEAVLAQCDLFLNEGKALQEKTEKAQKSWAQREQSLQAEAAQLQEKYQKGLITSRDAQAQQESIQKRVASYQTNAQKEAQTLDEENYVFTNRAQDLLQRAVQEINADKRYKLIINASALIDADTTLNITPAVLKKVNELYAADKKADKAKN
ncbi:OmpH family outer membrane protein [Alistipes sp.]|uniref:OmpH family outer membrane protein n=1 Tax=Alistipes sp. TaxID=1872444 RepID=UPI0025C2154A|nr:OmpH family outer membrane protein [Alistipes sp.]MCI7140749.1 OmpH family outer membrane protein [Alistipes sp.]MDY5397095.1 OmpH family outer membrane protein [Alistipes sp.]